MSTEITTVAIGALAGFITSYFFWKKDSLKDRPRINIKISYSREHPDRCNFNIKNEGFSHALNVTVEDYPWGEPFGDLAPGESFSLLLLYADQVDERVIRYEDPWGVHYETKWRLTGPHRYVVDDDELYVDENAVRLYEKITNTILSSIRRYLP